ncbi:hypothetical protein NOJ28_11335 [Neorhizobium galegae]|uniref:hypothetical protein n=1 Tax=Neorhizobium galegae TaxID=399 RepID=UPI0021038B08|nr:hypothetical protein [Neorhizobium galegae]MCQ1766128.1 hypothetical protein [Neorhizobium galegae]MCQ1845042.1 hypothetical protein [Neorhizobium galegae]
MNEPKTEEPAKVAAALDPEGIAKALFSEGEGKAKKDAREALRKLSGTWETLPVRLRSAIRADIGRLLKDGKTVTDVVAAGYSNVTVDRALRDLGRRG